MCREAGVITGVHILWGLRTLKIQEIKKRPKFGVISDNFKFLGSITVKEFLKSVNIW